MESRRAFPPQNVVGVLAALRPVHEMEPGSAEQSHDVGPERMARAIVVAAPHESLGATQASLQRVLDIAVTPQLVGLPCRALACAIRNRQDLTGRNARLDQRGGVPFTLGDVHRLGADDRVLVEERKLAGLLRRERLLRKGGGLPVHDLAADTIREDDRI
jgi:hypothetical protein